MLSPSPSPTTHDTPAHRTDTSIAHTRSSRVRADTNTDRANSDASRHAAGFAHTFVPTHTTIPPEPPPEPPSPKTRADTASSITASGASHPFDRSPSFHASIHSCTQPPGSDANSPAASRAAPSAPSPTPGTAPPTRSTRSRRASSSRVDVAPKVRMTYG